MSNYTPATATVILNLPYSMSQSEASLEAAPTGTGYTSTCDSTQYHAVWYQYTTTATQAVIFVSATYGTGAGNYDPRLSIWTGPLVSLTQYKIVGPSETQNFCGNLVGPLYFGVPVTPNTTYWFQITDHNNTSPLGDTLEFSVIGGPEKNVPVGSLVVNDDVNGYPAAVLNSEDASSEFLRFLADYPAGESSDSVPSGVYCVQKGEADTDVAILDSTFTATATASFSPRLVAAIKSNRVDTFYVVTFPNGGGVAHVHTVDLSGNIGATTWTLPANSSTAACFALSRGTPVLLYYGPRAASAVIHTYNLTTDSAGSDLHAAFGTESLVGFGDGYVASTGAIVFGYGATSAGATPKVRIFNAAGTVLQTITPGGSLVRLNHLAFADDDPGSFWIWGGPSAGAQANPATFQRYNLSGTLLATVSAIPVEGTSGGPGPSGATFWISNSCPLLITQASIAPPVPPIPPLGPITERPLRRVRQSPHLWDGKNNHRMFYKSFELLGEVGGPRDDISQPLQFALEVSADGGNTFGPRVWQNASMLGQYKFRVIWRTRFSARDCVVRVSDSNAARIVINDLLVDAEEGLS